MVDPFRVGAVIVEDGLHARSCELVAQAGSLLAPELVVVRATHLVGPSVAFGLGESDAPLGEGLLEPIPVDRSGVHERVSHLVAKGLLEPTGLEGLATQVPVRLRGFGGGQHLAALVAHELVVDLVQTVDPRGTALEGLPGQLVVVDDVDVVVEVPTRTVNVSNHEVVGGVHALGQEHAEHVDPTHMIGVVEVELIRREVLRVGVQLVATMVGMGELLGTGDEVLGRRHRR
ncbi:MAG: hypothetical protein WAQ25_00215 [Candidatus Saccharimonas sp.]